MAENQIRRIPVVDNNKVVGILTLGDLAKTPSREELYAKMLGCVNSPATGIAGAMNAVMSSLVRAIDAVAKQKSA